MADYRQIHTKIWRDDWFIDLPNDHKVLFFWLCTNEKARVSGIYEFSIKVAARETNIAREIVEEIIDEFIDAKKIMIEGEYIWVVNLRKYNDSFSANAYKSIMADLNRLPDCELKSAYIAYYQDIHDKYLEGLGNPLPGDGEPLDNPLPTPSGTENREQGTKNNEHRTLNTLSPEKPNLYQIARSLATVTGLDFDKNRPRLFRVSKSFKNGEEQQIIRDYGEGGIWYKADWRGQKRQKPTPEQVVETWNNLSVAKTPANNAGVFEDLKRLEQEAAYGN